MTNSLMIVLERLGLSQYYDALVDEAFDTWDLLLDIQESDFDALGVKLGHRRKLQRAITEHRAHLRTQPSVDLIKREPNTNGTTREDEDGVADGYSRDKYAAVGTNASGSTKRKYRRHPKPDQHAPERPPSAYVLFSNHVRETLKGRDLSFTEIAKVVGERWQELSSEQREPHESKSQSLKETYYTGLAKYKQEPEYQEYQEYLTDFKAKNDPLRLEGKRPRRDNVNGGPARSSSHDSVDHIHASRYHHGSWSGMDGHVEGHHIGRRPSDDSSASRPADSSIMDWQSGNPSPGTQSRSGLDSLDSPVFSPSSSATMNSFAYGRGRINLSQPLSAAALGPLTSFRPLDHPMASRHLSLSGVGPSGNSYAGDSPVSQSPATMTHPMGAPYGSMDTSSRRTLRNGVSNPPLMHADTSDSTTSSGAASSNFGGQMGHNFTPPLHDPSRRLSGRQLPPPVPSRMAHSSMDYLPVTMGSSQEASGLATLLRAGEHLANRSEMSLPNRGRNYEWESQIGRRRDRPP